MSSNTRNTKYFDGLVAKEIKDIIGCSTLTAQRRIGIYREGKSTYAEMLRPLGEKRNGFVKTTDGKKLGSIDIAKIRGCNQNHACACIRQYKKGEITLDELLSPVKKKYRYTHRKVSGGLKPRDYNLKKIPEPSVWERENM